MQYVDPSSKTTVSPIMWTALLFSFLISFYKALVVAHTVGGVVGDTVGSLILPSRVCDRRTRGGQRKRLCLRRLVDSAYHSLHLAAQMATAPDRAGGSISC